LTEKHLAFTFEGWDFVLKWDKETAYVKGVGKTAGSKAVDFVALRSSADVLFLEVKDFRGVVFPKGKNRDELLTVVSAKVRDTIAGIVGASYTRDDTNEYRRLVAHWRDRRRIIVVFWLESDAISGPLPNVAELKRKAEIATLVDELKTKLAWLTKSVYVANVRAPLPNNFGIVGKNLAGAGQVT
jgi:hypothetical protein